MSLLYEKSTQNTLKYLFTGNVAKTTKLHTENTHIRINGAPKEAGNSNFY